jgi:hypothetical protein
MAETNSPGPPRTLRPAASGPVRTPPPQGEGPLVTDGMQARRRDIERRRRDWRREQEMLQEEAQEGWSRVWKIVGVIVLVAGAVYAYWRIQDVYHDRWPISFVWGALALALSAGIGWMLWYINKSDI